MNAPAQAQIAAPVETALKMAELGFRVFPLRDPGEVYKDRDGQTKVSDGKTPLIGNFSGVATGNKGAIQRDLGSGRNYGIATGDTRTTGAGTTEHLAVLDLDRKLGKDGVAWLRRVCEEQGIDPDSLDTLTVRTPTGGMHLFFWTAAELKQGVDVLGKGSGVDIRAFHGFVVGPGSVIDGAAYEVIIDDPVATMPAALMEVFPKADATPRQANQEPVEGVDPARARARAAAIAKEAPAAVEGQGGDALTLKVACRLKDAGVSEAVALEVMTEHFNPRCAPPWGEDELATKLRNAWRYGMNPPGCAAPEAVFDEAEEEGETLHPLEAMNKRFAFIKGSGAHVLEERKDSEGRPATEHLSIQAFHAIHANRPFQESGEKARPISKAWMEWQGRREYDGIVFDPSMKASPNWFNVWQGFSVESASSAKHPAVEAFKEHALKNVCGGDQGLFRWLMGYFAHMIQRPSEKPLVALVFRGKKGTGKNALVERVGHLLGPHFLVADDDRYLLSNFNAHLENCLAMVLDEATWGGDKKAEGRLKGIITGSEHNIERKGCEHYRVKNLTRIMILGNDEWLVPASQDERRFAVFNVGEGRKQDRKFFQGMREGMEAGGYACLLRYFLDFDLSGVDVNDAPNTQGLADQKNAGLKGPHAWLRDVLTEGEIKSRIGAAWRWEVSGLTVPKKEAYETYADRSKRIYGEHHATDTSHFWPAVAAMCPKMRSWSPVVNGAQVRSVTFPPLMECRKSFEKALGGKVDWGDAGKAEEIDIFS